MIWDRKTQIQNEIVIIDKFLSQTKKNTKVKSAKKGDAHGLGYKIIKSDSNKCLQAAESLMNINRKQWLEKELESINKSIYQVNARIKNITTL